MQEMVWLALFILLLIIEIATMGLTTIWFAGGALAAVSYTHLYDRMVDLIVTEYKEGKFKYH